MSNQPIKSQENNNEDNEIKEEIKEKSSTNNNNNRSKRNSLISDKLKSFYQKDSTDITSNLSSTKRTETKFQKTKNVIKKKKRKKNKTKSKISFENEENNLYLTEVKKKEIEKKIEESQSHKFLRNKLEELKIPKNFQLSLQSSFDKIKENIKDNLLTNISMNETKKVNAEELIQKKKKYITINNNDNNNNNEIRYSINRQDMHRIKSLKYNNTYMQNELSRIVENKKLIEVNTSNENDIVGINVNNNKLENIKVKENDLLSKLKINKLKIHALIEENKIYNKRQLILKYNNNTSSKDLKTNNIKSRNNKNIFLELNPYYSLSDEQKRYNHQLYLSNQERLINKENFQKDLKLSIEKKIKELDLKEQQNIIQKKNYLAKLKNNEKEFFNKIKKKNNLILEISNKYINEKRKKKEKDYLFNKLKEKYEINEKKLIDKANLIKKDPLVTKGELNELSNKIKEQKKILEEGLNERKEKMIKMWKERSQTLPVYKHPIVEILEDEECDKLEDEEEKNNQKEKNNREKKNYKPPKVIINKRLKEIRENRNIKTTREALMRLEISNKNKLLSFIKLNSQDKDKNINNNKTKKLYKQKSSCENNNKILRLIHPKPDKPIDYLRILEKEREENKKNRKDIGVGVGNMFLNIESNKKDKKNIIQNYEDLEMAKSKCDAIDKKILEKKLFLKTKGGYMMNTKLGDEIGKLLIESIKSKLNMLKNKP